jgi:hypothetical protein
MDMTVFLIRFNNNGVLSKAIVLAENNIEAYKVLAKDYEEYGVKIDIEEYEIITDRGVALTWHEPIK